MTKNVLITADDMQELKFGRALDEFATECEQIEQSEKDPQVIVYVKTVGALARIAEIVMDNWTKPLEGYEVKDE